MSARTKINLLETTKKQEQIVSKPLCVNESFQYNMKTCYTTVEAAGIQAHTVGTIKRNE
jgi:hypothetical protein